MSVDIKLLKEICETPGVPGHEKLVRNLVLKEIEGLVDEVRVDKMGNVIALVKGESSEKCSMAAAHMDEIGFLVKHIDDKGFLRVTTLGGFDPKTLTSQRVVVHGKKDILGVMGSKPIHIMSPEERKRPAKIEDYFIDLGLPKKEVEKYISVGDPVTRERSLVEMGECINSKSLDNRISVYILIEVLKRLKKDKKKPSYDFNAVFTVQEEVGIRGARAATLEVQPDFGFGLDTTIAFDTPGAKPEERCTSLGQGVAIKIMDSSAICDVRMVSYLKSIAKEENITWQTEILAGGGTDTAGLQLMSAGGSIAGALSIPTRHIHQVIEMCHCKDVEATIELLLHAVCQLHKADWSF